MLIVSDTSPIVNLAQIHHLHLLPDLFDEIIIPDAVFREITIQGAGEPGDKEIREAKWVRILPVTSSELLQKLKTELDPGEAEAIVLALELHADYILMDESMGRTVAKQYHLNTLGLLGVLIRAKSQGLVPAVQPLMDRLRAEANFFIHKDLYQQVLVSAGEIAGP